MPTPRRGLALALSSAVDLVEVLDEHGDERAGLAVAMDERVADHIVPFYEDQAAIDSARLEMLRHHIFGGPAPATASVLSDRVTFAELRAAARFDPTVFRALWRVMGMIGRPAEIYTDPHIVARTRETLREHAGGPSIAQPPRERVLAALNRTAGRPSD